MSTRNILDYLGNTIGQLTLDDSTSESDWTNALNPYSINPTTLVNVLSGLTTINLNAKDTVTTSSSTAATIGSMTSTPKAGTYTANFSGSIYTAGASAVGEFGIYVDGVLLAESRRDISCNLQLLGGLVTVSLNSIGVGTNTSTEIYLNGNNVIDVRFRSTNGGTIGFKERVFNLVKVR